jgi:TolB protein
MVSDGKRLAFISDQFRGFDIYTMAPDGSSVRRLTGIPPAPAFTNSQPTWSPDGTAIAFESARTGEHDIFRMAPDGIGQTDLTNTPGSAEMIPNWSPDGTKIAFQRSRSGSGNVDVFVMGANGGPTVQLTESPAFDGVPAWSPDGSRIAFQSNRDGRDEMYVMDADGSNETRVTFEGANTWPDWQPLPQSQITKDDCKNGGFRQVRVQESGPMHRLCAGRGSPRPLTFPGLPRRLSCGTHRDARDWP